MHGGPLGELTYREFQELFEAASAAWGRLGPQAKRGGFVWCNKHLVVTHTTFRMLVHTPDGELVAQRFDCVGDSPPIDVSMTHSAAKLPMAPAKTGTRANLQAPLPAASAPYVLPPFVSSPLAARPLSSNGTDDGLRLAPVPAVAKKVRPALPRSIDLAKLLANDDSGLKTSHHAPLEEQAGITSPQSRPLPPVSPQPKLTEGKSEDLVRVPTVLPPEASGLSGQKTPHLTQIAPAITVTDGVGDFAGPAPAVVPPPARETVRAIKPAPVYRRWTPPVRSRADADERPGK